MREIFLEKHVIFVLMGVVTVAGILSKCVVNVSLRRLVTGAGNMSKSTHPLMRLVRAKFEHACMVSEKVENVGAFVDKYLYEYRVAGIKLHSWRRMELGAAGMCVVLGGGGAYLEYTVKGMQEMVLRTGGFGAALAVLLFLFHKTTDENYRLEAARNYMVDYLENVCLHRYEKVYQKEAKKIEKEEEYPTSFQEAPGENREPQRPRPGREVPSPRTSPELEPPAMPEPYPMPDVTPPIRGIAEKEELHPEVLKEMQSIKAAAKAEAKTEAKAEAKAETEVRPEKKEIEKKELEKRETEKKEPVDKDMLIRQILEEFMA